MLFLFDDCHSSYDMCKFHSLGTMHAHIQHTQHLNLFPFGVFSWKSLALSPEIKASSCPSLSLNESQGVGGGNFCAQKNHKKPPPESAKVTNCPQYELQLFQITWQVGEKKNTPANIHIFIHAFISIKMVVCFSWMIFDLYFGNGCFTIYIYPF